MEILFKNKQKQKVPSFYFYNFFAELFYFWMRWINIFKNPQKSLIYIGP